MIVRPGKAARIIPQSGHEGECFLSFPLPVRQSASGPAVKAGPEVGLGSKNGLNLVAGEAHIGMNQRQFNMNGGLRGWKKMLGFRSGAAPGAGFP